MATWEEVRRLVAALPETDEHASYHGRPSWRVRGKGFVWERPLGKADRAAMGDAVPAEDDPVLGVRVADVGIKAALLADDPSVYFTIPHFDGYPAVLVRLDRIGPAELAELVEEAWRLRAPRQLVARYDGEREQGGRPSPD